MKLRWLVDHEAGHAVAWVVLNMAARRAGHRILRVAVEAYGGGYMQTEGDDLTLDDLERSRGTPDKEKVRKTILNEAIVRYAGPAAETKSRGCSSQEGWDNYRKRDVWGIGQQWNDDLNRAFESLAILIDDGPDAHALLKRKEDLTWEEAWTLVTAHWGAIRALGDVLMQEEGGVDGEEAMRIIHRATCP